MSTSRIRGWHADCIHLDDPQDPSLIAARWLAEERAKAQGLTREEFMQTMEAFRRGKPLPVHRPAPMTAEEAARVAWLNRVFHGK